MTRRILDVLNAPIDLDAIRVTVVATLASLLVGLI